MPMTDLTINLNAEVQRELAEQLSAVGLTPEEYFTLAAKQFLIQGKVPFEIKTAPPARKVTFNEKTRKAIVRAAAEEEGVVPNTAEVFTHADDAMKKLFDGE